jgi:hypothetical protein
VDDHAPVTSLHFETIIEQNGTVGKSWGEKNIGLGLLPKGGLWYTTDDILGIVYSLLDKFPRKRVILNEIMKA